MCNVAGVSACEPIQIGASVRALLVLVLVLLLVLLWLHCVQALPPLALSAWVHFPVPTLHRLRWSVGPYQLCSPRRVRGPATCPGLEVGVVAPPPKFFCKKTPLQKMTKNQYFFIEQEKEFPGRVCRLVDARKLKNAYACQPKLYR